MSRSVKDRVEESLSEIWQRERDFETAIQEAAESEHQYKIAHARAYLSATGTVDERKAQALIECENLHKDYLKNEAIATFVKEKLRDSQQALSARQSLLSFEAKTNFGSMGAGA